jgi:hypothetical protein
MEDTEDHGFMYSFYCYLVIEKSIIEGYGMCKSAETGGGYRNRFFASFQENKTKKLNRQLEIISFWITCITRVILFCFKKFPDFRMYRWPDYRMVR